MSIRAAYAINLGSIVAAALWSAAVSAQVTDGSAGSPATAPQGTAAQPTDGIADIVVTAQRRAENVQDIPIAITAFSGETLENANISSLEELQGRTPGLVLNSFSPGQPEVAIRGIGTKEDGAGASEVEPAHSAGPGGTERRA